MLSEKLNLGGDIRPLPQQDSPGGAEHIKKAI